MDWLTSSLVQASLAVCSAWARFVCICTRLLTIFLDIGSFVANEAIKQGYAVRGAVRTETKGKLLMEVFDKKYGPGKFEVASVPNMTAERAYNEAIKGRSPFLPTLVTQLPTHVSSQASPQSST